ncbi:STAS domain-containing protein [Jidongwangia harbinensis]|uniref:STAS domain-containing protein n=1 Tax=Jidongwangia harbinensis TaxID=2878561 RepID=UPI001CD9A41C|nr:STAS domain-containing protein [Jidongwangia harbinensis]MCA2217903.1 STAS domain-containing protein [Jidongwangia harbinensis]
MTGQVTSERMGRAELIRLAGDLDVATAPTMGREIVSCVRGAGAVLLDLTAVAFLDSAGVRLLDALVADLDRLGTPIRLVVGERGPARMTLQLCAFRDDLLAVDVAEAADGLTG